MAAPIAIDELDTMAEIFRLEGAAPDGRWAQYSGRVLALPGWFDMGLDPEGEAYRTQQFKLWRLIAGCDEPYDPARDEQAPEVATFDTLRFPGFYARRDPAAISSAGDHLVALGHLVKLSGLRAGDTAIEYGAGFGQIALTLARLGVQVDAVDINPMFNAAVRRQAEIFGVPLAAVHGSFGDNPRPGSRYDAVIFYESFHHCPDTAALIGKLRGMLKPTGVVLMAGEPIAPPCDIIPYPWGMRLDSETVAVVRWRHWFELGFQEDYLVRTFISNGFVWQKHPCPITHYGEAHSFRPRPPRIEMATYAMPTSISSAWHAPEPIGRWTAGPAELPIDQTGDETHVRVELGNYLPSPVSGSVRCGPHDVTVRLAPGERTVATLPREPGEKSVAIDFAAMPAPAPGDDRRLGIYVHAFEYLHD